MKPFHITDVISAYHGYLVSTSGMDGLVLLLNYLTQDDLFTHQLPRAMDECHAYLAQSYPALPSIEPKPGEGVPMEEWVAAIVAKYGEHVTLAPMPAGLHEYRHPLEELQSMMRPDQKLLVVQAPGRDPRPRGYSHSHWRLIAKARRRAAVEGMASAIVTAMATEQA